MKVIYKTAIPSLAAFTVRFAVPFTLLKIGMQDGKPKMWFLLDGVPPFPESTPKFEKTYRLEATGVKFEQPPRGKMVHAGTIIDDATGFVGHIFEVQK